MKYEGEVVFKVRVEVDLPEDATDAQIEEAMLEKGIDNWKYSAEHEVEIY